MYTSFSYTSTNWQQIMFQKAGKASSEPKTPQSPSSYHWVPGHFQPPPNKYEAYEEMMTHHC